MVFKASPDCIVCAYGDGVALLDQSTSDYYSLDPVGATVWSVIENASASGAAFDDLINAVTESFDVSAETCLPDVKAFLSALESAKLVERCPA